MKYFVITAVLCYIEQKTNGKHFCLDFFNRISTNSSTKPFWVWLAPKKMKKSFRRPKTSPHSQEALQVPQTVWNPWCNHSDVCMHLSWSFFPLLLFFYLITSHVHISSPNTAPPWNLTCAFVHSLQIWISLMLDL